MANVKITDLTTHTNPASTDVLPIVDVGADVTKKVSIADLLKNAGSGTADAPGIAFDGDNDTGIYRPDPDQLAISTNGQGRLFIDASGRVGVGTSSPNSLLHVQGSGITVENNTVNLGEAIRLSNSSTDGAYKVLILSLNGGTAAGVTTWQNAGVLESGGSGGLAVSAYQGPLNFYSNDRLTSRLHINTAGRVGIGTTSPDVELSIQSSSINCAAKLKGSSSTNGSQIQVSSSDFILRNRDNGSIQFWTNDSQKAQIDTSGRLLVGTSTGITLDSLYTYGIQQFSAGNVSNQGILLENGVNSSAHGKLTFAKNRQGISGGTTIVQSGDPLGASLFYGADGTKYVQAANIAAFVDGTPGANDMPGRLVFSTNGGSPDTSPTERMRITSNGDLLVGASSRSSKLVNKSIEAANYRGYFINRYTTSAVYSGNNQTVTITFPDVGYSNDFPAMGTIEAGIVVHVGVSAAAGSPNISYVKRIRDFITTDADGYTSDPIPQQVWLNSTLDMVRGSYLGVSFSVSGRVVTVTFTNTNGLGQAQIGSVVLSSSVAPSSVVAT